MEEKKFDGPRAEWETFSTHEKGGIRVTTSRLRLPSGSRFSMNVGAVRPDNSTAGFIQLRQERDLVDVKFEADYFGIVKGLLTEAEKAVREQLQHELGSKQEYLLEKAQRQDAGGPKTRHTGKTEREREKKKRKPE